MRFVRVKRARHLAICTSLLLSPTVSNAQIDQLTAQSYFDEATILCERDAGMLCGISLCGPLLFADAATGEIATNRYGATELGSFEATLK